MVTTSKEYPEVMFDNNVQHGHISPQQDVIMSVACLYHLEVIPVLRTYVGVYFLS